MGKSLNWHQLPLGIAVLSWAVSIYLGITAIKYRISSLFANNVYIDIVEGRHPDVGNNPHNIQIGVKAMEQVFEHNSNRSKSIFFWQERLFYGGMILFIVWHILEMVKNTT